MKKQQGNMLVWIIIIVALAVAAFWYIKKYGYNLPKQTATTMDLDVAAKDLDGTDINQMDSGINGVASDSTSF